MTVIIDLPPEKEEALKAQAYAHGLSIEQWLLQLVEQNAFSGSAAHLQKTDPKEWMRRFRAWAESHDRTTPLLSDQDVSRESIYPDRI